MHEIYESIRLHIRTSSSSSSIRQDQNIEKNFVRTFFFCLSARVFVVVRIKYFTTQFFAINFLASQRLTHARQHDVIENRQENYVCLLAMNERAHCQIQTTKFLGFHRIFFSRFCLGPNVFFYFNLRTQ